MTPIALHNQQPQLVQLSQPQQQVRVISSALVHQLQAQGLTVNMNIVNLRELDINLSKLILISG